MAFESSLSIGKLHEALQHMPSNEAPGPDGFPVQFYKEFDCFGTYISQVKENGRLFPNMNSANIILQQKPRKDPLLPSSYRPLSQINVDLKMICKALAKRIEKITPLIIHPDKTGFIKGRHSNEWLLIRPLQSLMTS